MLGNSVENSLGSILATMLIQIYNMLYRPDNMVTIFTEFDDHIFNVFTDGWFGTIFSALKSIGLGFLVATFLMSLMDSVTDGDYTINNFFRHWLRFFILYIVLFNAMDIFKYLLQLSSDVANEMIVSVNSQMMNTGKEIIPIYLANGINKKLGIVKKIAVFMMALFPFVLACLYTIIMYFFAASRLFEITVRIAMCPLVAGLSYFTKGLQSDFIRYVKRTMGVFFQIVVILVISYGVTVTHNALINSNSATSSSLKVGNPAMVLQEGHGFKEILVKGAYRDAVPEGIVYDDGFYTKNSINDFIYKLLDLDNYFLSAGIMVSGIYMILKSRELSTQAFG